jgi:hypothetical protein
VEWLNVKDLSLSPSTAKKKKKRKKEKEIAPQVFLLYVGEI